MLYNILPYKILMNWGERSSTRLDCNQTGGGVINFCMLFLPQPPFFFCVRRPILDKMNNFNKIILYYMP